VKTMENMTKEERAEYEAWLEHRYYKYLEEEEGELALQEHAAQQAEQDEEVVR